MSRRTSAPSSSERRSERDTIFALASGRPPAAIAIVRISGPNAHEAARSLAGELPEARHAAVRGLRSSDGELLDEALVLRFDRAASATGEDVVEFHCHGGRAIIDAVLAELGRVDGVRLAEAGEFTRRAFENGRIDLTEAEGLADLLEAETQSQRRAALALAEGGLRLKVEEWQARVLALSARAEAAIDYDEEDGLGADPQLGSNCERLAAELRQWLERPRIEPLRDGLRVVLAGPPNSGKSSLLNVIAGSDKAIVTAIPGTTRDQIEVPLSLEGVPIILTDTAGLRDSSGTVERIGVERARASADGADILVWLGEPADAPEHQRLIKIHPRCDVPGRECPPPGSLAASSVTSQGVAELLATIRDLGRSIIPAEGALALNRRQADAIVAAAELLGSVAAAPDLLIAAEALRATRAAFDRLTGRAGVEDVLDALFSRFCLGK
ncbi:MAG: tRNA uridine-5-carboxymethylaminomethyl(34) synthesis GTPase MnmE [Sphingomicrobium sp.]